jgi:pilus assembly protein CpaB
LKKIYLLALIFAVLTGVAVFLFATNLQKSPEVETVDVLIAVRPIAERTLVTADMVEVRKFPVEAAHPLALNAKAAAVGKITRVAIEANEQILGSKLTDKGGELAGLSYNIPEGKRAISIEVNETSGVSGYLKAGDRVDIVAALMIDSGMSKAGAVTKVSKTVLLLQNIEVLVVNVALTDKETKPTAYKNITLAVTPQEALELFYAQINGRITVVLRPPLSTDAAELSPYAP